MRLDQSKHWMCWAGVVCLTSVGCVHQQHQSAEKQPFASAQSSQQFKASGQTSNTGRVAVVNDPTQWPERPSDDHVKSRFPQLFPNLAQRADRPLRVQIGQPEPITAQVNDSANPPESTIIESSDKLAEVTEVPTANDDDDAPKVSKVEAEPKFDKSLWANLSQHSAGAISAVAAMAALTNHDQPEPAPQTVLTDVPKVKSEDLATQVTSKTPQPEPLKQPSDSVMVKEPEASSISEQLSAASTPPAKVELPTAPSLMERSETSVEAAEQPSVVSSVQPTVAEPVSFEPPKVLAETKSPVSQLPVKQEVAPVPSPLPVAPESPAIPTVVAIPNAGPPETKLVVQDQPPVGPAEDLIAKIEKPNNPGSTGTSELASGKDLEKASSAVPEVPRIALEIPALPVQNGEKSVAKVLEEPAEQTLATRPAERVALAVPALRPESVDPSPAQPLPQIVPIQPDPNLKAVDPKLPVPSDAVLKPPVSEALAEQSKLGVPSAELPPVTPAPELQIPGLPSVPANSVGLPESKPVSNSPSDKGVERSSAPPAEPEKLVDSKPVDVRESESSLAVEAVKPVVPTNPSVTEPIQAEPVISEEAVPVLKPLPEESGAGQGDSVMGPNMAGPQNRPGEIVIRMNVFNPFRRRSLGTQNEVQASSGSGLKSLRTAAVGLFDWREKASLKTVETNSANHLRMFQQSEGASRRTAAMPLPAPENHSEVSQVQPVQADLSRNGQVKSVVNSRQIASLPPIQFPATYTTARTQSANPWVNHKVPAIDLVGRPVVSPRIADTSVSDQVAAGSDLGVAQPRPSKDLAVKQTSMTTVSQANGLQPASPPVARVKPSTGSVLPTWWSRAGKGLRSIWSDEDEVVPPKRQNWAGGEMSLTR